jgi:RNA polymerase sigma-70 factor (ECF subfamily)
VASGAIIERRGLRLLPGADADARKPRPTETELIEAVQRGDDRVANEIYNRLIGVVDRTLYRVLGRRERDHRDLIQATFEQVVLTVATGRFARACSLETWAAAIATKIGLKSLRSRRREEQVIEPAADPDAQRISGFMDAERELDARAQLAEVRRHLAAMSPGQATTLFLHDGLGHNLSEIAVMTGASVAAAQSRLVRGRRELARRLRASEAGKEKRR